MEEAEEGGNSLKSLKIRNRLLVLSFLRCAGPVSVTEISRATTLSKMTVHKIIDYYIGTGMVVSAGKGGSTEDGGKKPNLFAFNPNCYCVFGVRLGNDYFLSSIVNLTGEHLVGRKRVTFGDVEFSQVMDLVHTAFVEQFSDPAMKARRLGQANCLAAVVGVNGIVDSENYAYLAPYRNPKWGVNVPLKEELEKRLPGNVKVQVDSWWRHLAQGELLARESEKKNRFFLIGNSGDCVSGGLVADGKVFHGANGLAGEVGHVVVDSFGGDTCICGGTGCLEAAVAPSRIAARARERREKYPESPIFSSLEAGASPLPVIVGAAEQGDRLGRELIREAAWYFAVAINNIVQICDPGSIIVYGDYANAGDYFMDSLRERFASLALQGIDRRTSIERSKMEDSQGLIGAAHSVAENLCSGTFSRA